MNWAQELRMWRLWPGNGREVRICLHREANISRVLLNLSWFLSFFASNKRHHDFLKWVRQQVHREMKIFPWQGPDGATGM